MNRAGRWSAAARQAYLIRSPLVQPLFGDQVVLAARPVPLRERITDRLHRGILAELSPGLLDLPLAGSGWKSGPQIPPSGPRRARARPAQPTGGGPMANRWPGCSATTPSTSAPRAGCSTWCRRSAAERALRPPQRDSQAVWALATLAALLSGDWLNARPAGPSPAASISPDAGRVPE